MMDRRGFLKRLGFGTVAAAAAANGLLDVERLLWVPGEKTIILPPTVYENVWATADWVTMESLKILSNQLAISAYFNADYDPRFRQRLRVSSSPSIPNWIGRTS